MVAVEQRTPVVMAVAAAVAAVACEAWCAGTVGQCGQAWVAYRRLSDRLSARYRRRTVVTANSQPNSLPARYLGGLDYVRQMRRDTGGCEHASGRRGPGRAAAAASRRQ